MFYDILSIEFLFFTFKVLSYNRSFLNNLSLVIWFSALPVSSRPSVEQSNTSRPSRTLSDDQATSAVPPYPVSEHATNSLAFRMTDLVPWITFLIIGPHQRKD